MWLNVPNMTDKAKKVLKELGYIWEGWEIEVEGHTEHSLTAFDKVLIKGREFIFSRHDNTLYTVEENPS